MKKLVFLCAAVVMAASATTVSTSPALAGANQVVIETAAFNLQSNAGRSAVEDRINRAGSDVCGSPAREIEANRDFSTCRDLAVAGGMAQLNALSHRGSVSVGTR